jgi:uncharacterized protein
MPPIWFQRLDAFSRIAVAIFLEAAPFLLLGALISAVMSVYVDPAKLARLIPRNRFFHAFIGLGGGMILPICECGSVPVARRLMEKGVSPQFAVTYMLAAPVINPIVLVSTYIAFRNDLFLVLLRALLVALPALILGYAFAGKEILSKNDLQPEHCGCADTGHTCVEHGAKEFSAIPAVLEVSAREFLYMGKFLIFGCMAAAFFKVYLPWELLHLFETNLFTAVALLMALAVLLSVCSEADAFVVASFVSFPVAAQLSFVALGPMVDLKLIGMYYAVFRKNTATTLILAPIVIIYPLSIALGLFMR